MLIGLAAILLLANRRTSDGGDEAGAVDWRHGRAGGEVATALSRHGWTVRGLARDPPRAGWSGPAGVGWVAGDAMREQDVQRAAST